MLANQELLPPERELAGRARGGKARADSMSPERRKEVAAKAAAARWNSDEGTPSVPRATHMGVLKIGDTEIPCAVLENGQRVLTERAFLRAIGRDARAKSAKHIREGDAVGLPPFMTARALEPYIQSTLKTPSVPLRFVPPEGVPHGRAASGYRAELLPEVCRVFVAAARDGKLTKQQLHVALKCQVLLDGLATVGIIALVDEATGFQSERSRGELQAILAAYVSPEFLPWEMRFPNSYYEEMFRLMGWAYSPPQVKKPKLIGKLTDELIYKQLPPGVREELQRKNPPNAKGHRRLRNHQLLTPEIGNRHLEKQIAAVTTLMKASEGDKQLFKRLFQAAFPKPGQQLSLGLTLDEDDT